MGGNCGSSLMNLTSVLETIQIVSCHQFFLGGQSACILVGSAR
jgi:hypothetical protein